MAKTMEELLASQPKLITLYRGQEVEGEIVTKNERELVLDLGAKAEGVISVRDIPSSKQDSLKIGDKIKAFVIVVENESSQAVLSFNPAVETKSVRGFKGSNWSKFQAAQNQKSKLSGRVIEVNKGGLIVEVAGVRGFLPNSQVGFELLNKASKGMEGLIGQDISVAVIEIDALNNKLIFSQRGKLEELVLKRLEGFKNNQKVSARIVCILPFGLVVSAAGLEGMVYISDVSWDKIDDLNSIFEVGQEIEAMVLDVDRELGRVNLSMKQLAEDPFTKAAQQFTPDETVKAEVTVISETGVFFKLEGPSGEFGTSGVEGFLPSAKVDPDTKYETGKIFTMLVDSIDTKRRKVNLAPFVTSTAGMIYK